MAGQDNLTSLYNDTTCLVVRNLSAIASSEERPADENLISPTVVFLVMRVCLVLSFLVSVLGSVGNVVNMIVFWRLGLGQTINLCLAWLAFADLMSLVFNLIYTGASTVQVFAGAQRLTVTHYQMVIFNYGLLQLSCFRYVAFFMYAVVAVERCLSVFLPLQVKELRRRVVVVIVFAGSAVVGGLQTFSNLFYRIRCVLEVGSWETSYVIVLSDVYVRNREVFDVMSGLVQGVVTPALTVTTVLVANTITILALRRSTAWRQFHTPSPIQSESQGQRGGGHPVGGQLGEGHPVGAQQDGGQQGGGHPVGGQLGEGHPVGGQQGGGHPVGGQQSGGQQGGGQQGGGHGRTNTTVMSSAPSGYLQQQVAITRMLLTVTFIYVVCTVPAFTHKLARLIEEEYEVDGRYKWLSRLNFNIFNFLINLNSAINIVVYYCLGTRYREQCRRLLGLSPRRRPSLPPGSRAGGTGAGQTSRDTQHTHSYSASTKF